MKTILLIVVSNIFMTFAWYDHLRFKDSALWKVVLVSWLVAFVEYCFQVPAKRLGHSRFSAAQLKTIQEVITLVVFAVFSVVYLRESLRWNYLVGFACILAAVFFVFKNGSCPATHDAHKTSAQPPYSPGIVGSPRRRYRRKSDS